MDEIARTSTSRGKDHTSVSEQIHDTEVVSVAELRRLPFGWGILLNRNGQPILMQVTRWWDRKDGKQIKEAAGRYSKALLAELESDAPAPSTPTGADRAEEAVAAWDPVPETAPGPRRVRWFRACRQAGHEPACQVCGISLTRAGTLDPHQSRERTPRPRAQGVRRATRAAQVRGGDGLRPPGRSRVGARVHRGRRHGPRGRVEVPGRSGQPTKIEEQAPPTPEPE